MKQIFLLMLAATETWSL